MTEERRGVANTQALHRLCASDPVLVDVRPAREVVPGMADDMILTSGPPLAWSDYRGGQRRSIAYAAVFEGLASEVDDAEARLADGRIRVAACQDHSCVGSVAGVYTASMPVLVVENRAFGNRAFCNLYEGDSRKRLNYGAYDADVERQLRFLEHTVAPVLAEAVRRRGGVALKPIMTRALHMGDELHSRNTAATLLFARELYPTLLDLAGEDRGPVDATLAYLATGDYFFLRLSMAANKATADSAHGIEASSVVSSMAMYCNGVAIRVSGLGDAWHLGPYPDVEAKLFDGFTDADLDWIGGESIINETAGLGGFAQAAAFPLQRYQGGSPDAMIRLNLDMYAITVGEHTD
ncbi:MAG: YlbE family protein, partial [Acidimicrobiales bacterium]